MGHRSLPKIKALFTALLLTLQFNPLIFAVSPAYAVAPGVPDIVVLKDDGLDSVVPGQTITYNIIVANVGNQDATGVEVVETMPDHTTFNSWYLDNAVANGSFETGDFTDWTENDPGGAYSVMGAVATHTGSYGGRVQADGAGSEQGYIEQTISPYIPVSEVSELSIWWKYLHAHTGPRIEVTYSDNSTTAVEVNSTTAGWTQAVWTKWDITSELTVGKTVKKIKVTGYQGGGFWDPGKIAYFDDLVLRADLEDGVTGCPTCAYTFAGPFKAGGEVSLSFTAALDDSVPSGVEAITNTVSAQDDGSYGDDPTPGNNLATDTDALIAAPDIIVLKEDDSADSIVPGQTVTYDITVTNAGNQDATGVEVEETVPEFTTFNEAGSTFGWSCSDGDPAGTACLYALGPLGAGDDAPLAFAVDVDDPPVPAGMEAIENTVTAYDDGTNGADLVPENNLYLDSDFLDASPDLQITKSDGGLTEVLAGGTVAYNLVCINTGTQDATGVIVEETVPKYTTFSASGSFCPLGWSCVDGAPAGTKCYCEVGSLPVGASSNLSFAVTVKAAIVGVNLLTNTATISDDGGSGPDLNSSDNEASDTTPVNPGEIAAIATVAEEEEEVAEEVPEEGEVIGVEEVLAEEEEPVAEEEEEAACQDPSWWISILILQGILSLLVSRFGKEWRRNAYVIQIVLALLAVLIFRRFFCTWWLPWAAVVLGLASLYLTSQRIQSFGGGSSGRKSKKSRR